MANPRIVIQKINVEQLTPTIPIHNDPPHLNNFHFHSIISSTVIGKEVIVTMLYLSNQP